MKATQAWLRSLKETSCRDIGHSWYEGGGKQTVAPGFFGREVTCEGCGTVRIDIYHRASGDLEMRRYIYPDWYKKPKEFDRIAKREFRLEHFRRMEPQATTKRMKFIWERKPGWRDM
jgi:hypothetical protein